MPKKVRGGLDGESARITKLTPRCVAYGVIQVRTKAAVDILRRTQTTGIGSLRHQQPKAMVSDVQHVRSRDVLLEHC